MPVLFVFYMCCFCTFSFFEINLLVLLQILLLFSSRTLIIDWQVQKNVGINLCGSRLLHLFLEFCLNLANILMTSKASQCGEKLVCIHKGYNLLVG